MSRSATAAGTALGTANEFQAEWTKAFNGAASVSPRTLTRQFRSVLGRSPLEYLHHLRCERAKILLELTLQSVPTVAAACGYNDPTAFRRMFARHQGQTPGLYRTQHAVRSSRKRWKVEDANQ